MISDASAPFTRDFLPLADGAVSYLAHESGKPRRLHFAHATGFNAQTYRVLLAPLTEHFDIRISDARGHGFTSLPADPAIQESWDTYADDFDAILDRWPGSPPILCGHSMGGTVSLLTAARRPGKVAGVLMLDPPIFGKDMTPATMDFPMSVAARRRRDTFASRAEMLETYRGRGAFRTWPDVVLADYIAGGTSDVGDGTVRLTCAPAWEAATFSGQRHHTWSAIRALTVPGLILTADRDSPTRIAGAEELQRENPALTMRPIAGANHFFPMEFPDLVRTEILDFAARL